METASSPVPTATISQASLPSENKKQRQEAQERSLPSRLRTTTHMGRRTECPVLLDITNDSPIVGLAVGNLKTPSSSVGKSRSRAAGKGTPWSGEALLRGQVKTLLQRVEEEAELVKVPSQEAASFQALLGHLRSPAGLLAPTPANTPQIMSLPSNREDPVPVSPSAQEDEVLIVQLVAPVVPREEEETPCLHQCLINRALQFDTPDESDVSGLSIALSSVTYHESELSSCTKKPMEEDCSSAWSLQTNPGSLEGEEEEEDRGDIGADHDDYNDGEEEEEGQDALCEGLRMMSMEQKGGLPEFAGKHTRFSYNSDGEMVGEEEIGVVSPGVLRLRGLPAPEGKHLRFPEEEED